VLGPWIGLLLLAAGQGSELERQAYRAYQARDWARAARYYQAFHAAGAGSASSYDQLGVALTNLGEWGRAEAALQKAIALDAGHRWAYNHLGWVHRQQGRLERAVELFERQISISPRDPYAYRNLAGTLAALDRLEEAEKAAEDHEQRGYERGAVYIDIACALNAGQRPEQALRFLRRAEAVGVERGLLAQESGHYFLACGDFRQAEREYRKLREYAPYEPGVALRLAMLYWKTGNLEKSAETLAGVLTVTEDGQVRIRTSAGAWKAVSLAELRRGPAAAAAAVGDLPVDLAAAALLIRVDGYRRRHAESPSPARLAKLRSAAAELLARDSSPQVQGSLGAWVGGALLEAGRLPEAIQELERAYAAYPQRRLAAYLLGSALDRSGRLDQALPHYVRSLKPVAGTAIDCGCEEPDLAAREKTARSAYARLRGEESGFNAYRDSIQMSRGHVP